MPRQGRSEKVELVDLTTGDIVTEFNSIRACARTLGLNPNSTIKKIRLGSEIKRDGTYIVRYKSTQSEVSIQQPSHTYTCSIHKVWVNKSENCPLCKAEKRI